jgi:hypothetical protein
VEVLKAEVEGDDLKAARAKVRAVEAISKLQRDKLKLQAGA